MPEPTFVATRPSACFGPSDIVIGDPHTPSPPTATVRLQSVLAQTVVPDGVNVFRASGFDASDNRLYGPETQPAGPVVDFTGVPVDVTVFLVEYLEGDEVLGVVRFTVDLEPGQVFVVASPDIETPLRSLSLDPDSATLAAGTEIELKAFGLFSDRSSLDLTGTARWSSSDETVATVEGGVVRAESAGGALITATVGEVSATAEITVSDAELVGFQVSAVGADTIAAGTRAEFRAVGTFSDETEQDVTSSADWTSVSDEIATTAGAGGQGGQPNGQPGNDGQATPP